jgi:glutamate 5-kinase
MKIITKLGTNAVFNSETEEIKRPVLERLAKDAYVLLNQGDELIVVSSGAVGCGKQILRGRAEIGFRQAQAAIGQPILMQEYGAAFNKYNLNIAQFLLTYDDLDSVSRTKKIKQAYEYLKQNRIIPIVNENDTTAIEELSFGDNDALATDLAIKLNFDTIINYTERGALVKDNKPIILTGWFNVEDYDNLKKSGTGFGGLKSKLDSAKKASEAKKQYIIAKAGDSVLDILENKVTVTRFL